MPTADLPISPAWQDFLHLPAFFGVTLLWILAFARLGLPHQRAVLAAAGLMLFLGFGTEIHQVIVPQRFFSPGDIALNLLGIGLAAVAPSCRSLMFVCGTWWGSGEGLR